MLNRWLRLPESVQYLKRTALCFRVSGKLLDMSASTVDKGETPMIVQFASGAARKAVDKELSKVFNNLHHDLALDIVAAVSALVGTAMDLILRFRQYEERPYTDVLMCRRYNVYYVAEIAAFLRAPERDLDDPFSLALRRCAESMGGEAAARWWLESPDVQDMLHTVGRAAISTSLPAERFIATAKKQEQTKVAHVAT